MALPQLLIPSCGQKATVLRGGTRVCPLRADTQVRPYGNFVV